MNQRVKKIWVKALRSGKYKQGKQALKIKNGFCCLGVLCDLYAKEKKMKKPWSVHGLQKRENFGDTNNDLFPPDEVLKWAGLKEKNPRVKRLKKMEETLSVLNDESRLGFKGIAKLIEEQL